MAYFTKYLNLSSSSTSRKIFNFLSLTFHVLPFTRQLRFMGAEEKEKCYSAGNDFQIMTKWNEDKNFPILL